MGRYLKNVELKSAGHALRVPVGSSSIGPSSPVTGQIRFNQDTMAVEFYLTDSWKQIARIGTVEIVISTFEGDGTTQSFSPMEQIVSNPSDIMVFIGGVYQIPNINYTVNGNTTISFTSPPPAPTSPGSNTNKIVVIHNLNSTAAV